MATYMPLISAFTQRTAFWPPEAFTLDCRIEERIWEWCERELKDNKEFMALVNSDKPLNMEDLWDTISATAYGNLTACIFHYWLIQNWTKYKAGGSICTENADWICERIKIKGPMPWPKSAPAPVPAPSAVAAAGGGGAEQPEADPEVIGPISARLDGKMAEFSEPRYTGPPLKPSLGPAPAGPLEDRLREKEKQQRKDVSVCLTSGNVMTVLRLSHVPTLSYDELRKYYRALQIHCGESWDPEECENAGIILEEIYNHLHA